MSVTLRVSVNGGGVQTGGVTCANDDTIQLSAASYVGWGAPAAKWRVYSFPAGFTEPAGWETVTETQADGSEATYYEYQGASPPSFDLPAAPTWGKFLLGLYVYVGGVLQTDETTALEIVSPTGLHDLAWREAGQFGGAEKWVADQKANLRAIEDVLNGGTILVDGVQLAADTGDQRVLSSTPYALAAHWVPGSNGVWTNAATGGKLYIPLNDVLPNACELGVVIVTITPAGGHGALPGTKPSLALKSRLLDGTVTTIATVTDAPADVPAYQQRRDLTLTLSPAETIGKEVVSYFLELTAESGTNSAVGTTYDIGYVVFTRPEGSKLGQD